MTEFDISFLFSVAELVKTVTLYSNNNSITDDRGEDQSVQTLIGTETAVVIPSDDAFNWQNRGVVVSHDLNVFIKEDTYLANDIVDGAIMEVDGIKYMIVGVDQNPGHFDLALKK